MQVRQVSLLFALILALATVPKARKLESPDFKVFYTAARHAQIDPVQMYRISPDRYLYPPSTATLLVPFAFTDWYGLHQWVWHGFLAVLLFALSSSSWAHLLAWLILTRYLAITFGYGQINLLVISLLAAAGKLGEKRAWMRSGILWALAVSVKVYPLVLAPFYFARDRWKAWFGFVALSFALFLLPFAVFGREAGVILLTDFLEALRAKGLPLHSHNQSFSALMQRLFTDQIFYLHAVGNAQWTLWAGPPWVSRVLALLVGGVLTFLSWKKAWSLGLRSASSLSAAAFSILFLSHIAWKDYFLFLFFPLSEILGSGTKKEKLWVAIPLLAIITFSAPDVLGHVVSTRLDAACVHLWGALLVWWAWWKK